MKSKDKMPFPFVKKRMIYVDYNDLEKSIQEFYGLEEYSIATTEEMSNDSYFNFDIDGSCDKWDLAKAIELLETKKAKIYSTRCYLNYMGLKEFLPHGEYMVNISW